MANLHEKILSEQTIDDAFKFYKLDERYKNSAYDCLREITSNKKMKKRVLELYETLFLKNTDKFRDLWKIKDIELLFGSKVNPFTTNLIILLGAAIHKEKMKTFKFGKEQVDLHKSRVRDCFVNDLEKRGYKGVRISQMLWASYFMNCRIIEVGILQYEYDSSIDKVKIHIPHLPKLDFDEVKKSLDSSKKEIKKYFGFDDKQYICNSWLLSKQLTPLLDDKSNIKKFQTLFRIKEGENCVSDILNHVYGLATCENYCTLTENSSLQRRIKHELMNGTTFMLGCGELI